MRLRRVFFPKDGNSPRRHPPPYKKANQGVGVKVQNALIKIRTFRAQQTPTRDALESRGASPTRWQVGTSRFLRPSRVETGDPTFRAPPSPGKKSSAGAHATPPVRHPQRDRRRPLRDSALGPEAPVPTRPLARGATPIRALLQGAPPAPDFKSGFGRPDKPRGPAAYPRLSPVGPSQFLRPSRSVTGDEPFRGQGSPRKKSLAGTHVTLPVRHPRRDRRRPLPDAALGLEAMVFPCRTADRTMALGPTWQLPESPPAGYTIKRGFQVSLGRPCQTCSPAANPRPQGKRSFTPPSVPLPSPSAAGPAAGTPRSPPPRPVRPRATGRRRPALRARPPPPAAGPHHPSPRSRSRSSDVVRPGPPGSARLRRGQIPRIERFSFSRSQRSGCSTGHDTPIHTQVVCK